MGMNTFEVDVMYDFVGDFSDANGLTATIRALPFAKEKHAGQFRKGEKLVPYISHPLTMACHAISMGLIEDDLLAAILLHDVCEDCGVSPANLPANRSVQNAVLLVTKEEGESKRKYFSQIGENRIASMVKLIDRCHNVSQMSLAFSREKLGKYIHETEEYILPLLAASKDKWPEHSQQYFLLEYQIVSAVQSVKALLERKDI